MLIVVKKYANKYTKKCKNNNITIYLCKNNNIFMQKYLIKNEK